MKTSRRYAVIGVGAVGGFYGGLLQRAGQEVHFLFHSGADAGVARAQGLRVDSIAGDFVLPQVNVHDRVETMPVCDVVVVALKTTANGALPALLPRLLAPGGVVVLLQNGLGAEERIAGIPGVGVVLGGLCFLCAHKVGPAHVRHLDLGHITMGQYAPDGGSAGITEILRQVHGDFSAAGIAVTLEADLLAARWRKLVWNMPFNGLTVLLGVTTAEIMGNPHSRHLAQALMLETAGASAAYDRPIAPEFINRMLSSTEDMRPYAPSMKLDYDAGRPLELESIYVEPMRRAQARGVAMPMTRFLHDALAFLSARRDAAAATGPATTGR